MKTCYNCGKIIFMNKVFGQIGDKMYTFCSEKCRSATWHKIGVKADDSLENSAPTAIDNTGYSFEHKESGLKSGSPSQLILEGAEYSYSARTDRVTISILALKNKSREKTGNLRFELFMSKSGPYKPDQQPEGYTMAASTNYEPLRSSSAYSNIKSTMRPLEKKAGVYNPVIFVREFNEDGEWYIVAYANFPKKEKVL
ncbi:MAG: hypothetical protein II098_04875 [Treponema sp.]|nr:hypothetical protein [Treponema sp.]